MYLIKLWYKTGWGSEQFSLLWSVILSDKPYPLSRKTCKVKLEYI
jgi:hypothetical protein